MKEKIVSALIGALVLAVVFLGYTFYKEISTINSQSVQVAQIESWICKVDPVTCGQKPVTPAPAATK